MADSSDILASLGLDGSAYLSGLAQAEAAGQAFVASQTAAFATLTLTPPDTSAYVAALTAASSGAETASAANADLASSYDVVAQAGQVAAGAMVSQESAEVAISLATADATAAIQDQVSALQSQVDAQAATIAGLQEHGRSSNEAAQEVLGLKNETLALATDALPALSGNLTVVNGALSAARGAFAAAANEELSFTATTAVMGAALTGAGVGAAAAFFGIFDSGLTTMKNMAAQFGMTIPQVAGLQTALESVGLPATQANMALRMMSTQLQAMQTQIDAGKEPTGKLATDLSLIGVNGRDAAGNMLPLSSLLPQVFDGFMRASQAAAAAGEPFNAAGIAAGLFGARAGPQMVPLLLEGAAGMQKYTDQATALGIGSESQVAHLEALHSATASATLEFEGMAMAIGSDVAPAVTAIVSVFGGAADAVGKLPGPLRDLVITGPLAAGVLLLTASAGAKLASSVMDLIPALITRTVVEEAVTAADATMLTADQAVTEAMYAMFAASDEVAAGELLMITGAEGAAVAEGALAVATDEAAAASMALAVTPLGAALLAIGVTVVGLTLLMQNDKSAADDLRLKYGELKAATSDAEGEIARFGADVGQMTTSLVQAVKDIPGLGAAVRGAGDMIGGAADFIKGKFDALPGPIKFAGAALESTIAGPVGVTAVALVGLSNELEHFKGEAQSTGQVVSVAAASSAGGIDQLVRNLNEAGSAEAVVQTKAQAAAVALGLPGVAAQRTADALTTLDTAYAKMSKSSVDSVAGQQQLNEALQLGMQTGDQYAASVATLEAAKKSGDAATVASISSILAETTAVHDLEAAGYSAAQIQDQLTASLGDTGAKAAAAADGLDGFIQKELAGTATSKDLAAAIKGVFSQPTAAEEALKIQIDQVSIAEDALKAKMTDTAPNSAQELALKGQITALGNLKSGLQDSMAGLADTRTLMDDQSKAAGGGAVSIADLGKVSQDILAGNIPAAAADMDAAIQRSGGLLQTELPQAGATGVAALATNLAVGLQGIDATTQLQMHGMGLNADASFAGGINDGSGEPESAANSMSVNTANALYAGVPGAANAGAAMRAAFVNGFLGGVGGLGLGGDIATTIQNALTSETTQALIQNTISDAAAAKGTGGGGGGRGKGAGGGGGGGGGASPATTALNQETAAVNSLTAAHKALADIEKQEDDLAKEVGASKLLVTQQQLDGLHQLTEASRTSAAQDLADTAAAAQAYQDLAASQVDVGVEAGKAGSTAAKASAADVASAKAAYDAKKQISDADVSDFDAALSKESAAQSAFDSQQLASATAKVSLHKDSMSFATEEAAAQQSLTAAVVEGQGQISHATVQATSDSLSAWTAANGLVLADEQALTADMSEADRKRLESRLATDRDMAADAHTAYTNMEKEAGAEAAAVKGYNADLLTNTKTTHSLMLSSAQTMNLSIAGVFRDTDGTIVLDARQNYANLSALNQQRVAGYQQAAAAVAGIEQQLAGSLTEAQRSQLTAELGVETTIRDNRLTTAQDGIKDEQDYVTAYTTAENSIISLQGSIFDLEHQIRNETKYERAAGLDQWLEQEVTVTTGIIQLEAQMAQTTDAIQRARIQGDIDALNIELSYIKLMEHEAETAAQDMAAKAQAAISQVAAAVSSIPAALNVGGPAASSGATQIATAVGTITTAAQAATAALNLMMGVVNTPSTQEDTLQVQADRLQITMAQLTESGVAATDPRLALMQKQEAAITAQIAAYASERKAETDLATAQGALTSGTSNSITVMRSLQGQLVTLAGGVDKTGLALTSFTSASGQVIQAWAAAATTAITAVQAAAAPAAQAAAGGGGGTGGGGASGNTSFYGGGTGGSISLSDFLSGKYSSWGTPGGAQSGASMGVGLPHYQAGTSYVPEDQLAFLHRGEAVIPPGLANGQQGGAFRGGSGGPVTLTVNTTVNGSNLTPAQLADATQRGAVAAVQQMLGRGAVLAGLRTG